MLVNVFFKYHFFMHSIKMFIYIYIILNPTFLPLSFHHAFSLGSTHPKTSNIKPTQEKAHYDSMLNIQSLK